MSPPPDRSPRALAAAVRLRLWRLKVRLLPWTRPRPRDLPAPGRPGRWTEPARKHSGDWGASQARALWSGLYEPKGLVVDGATVLDLGCSWGYLLRHLATEHAPARLIGVDVSPLWDTAGHGWDWRAERVPIEFHAGELSEIGALADASVDLVLCTSTLQYMTPEQVEANLARAYALLRPGGRMVLRTRVFTSYIGADLHRTFAKPYVHLLYGEEQLARLARERTGADPRYLNWLTASTYTAMMHRAGFEIAGSRRRPNGAAPGVLREVAERVPAPAGELGCAELEAELVRPLGLEDLPALADIVDTRPASMRGAPR